MIYLDFGSGPGGGDYREYFLSKDDESWTLWDTFSDVDIDDGEVKYSRVAECYSSHEDQQSAARCLLAATLLAEKKLGWNTSFESFSIMKKGILDIGDVTKIVNELLSKE